MAARRRNALRGSEELPQQATLGKPIAHSSILLFTNPPLYFRGFSFSQYFALWSAATLHAGNLLTPHAHSRMFRMSRGFHSSLLEIIVTKCRGFVGLCGVIIPDFCFNLIFSRGQTAFVRSNSIVARGSRGSRFDAKAHANFNMTYSLISIIKPTSPANMPLHDPLWEPSFSSSDTGRLTDTD